MQAKDHYEKLLGPVYSWMVGDIEIAMSRADAELETIGLHSNASGTAVDLGAGFGMHSIPLARRGYQVLAVDSYEPLLTELKTRAGSLAIRTVNANLLEFKSNIAQPADVILCMGDSSPRCAARAGWAPVATSNQQLPEVAPIAGVGRDRPRNSWPHCPSRAGAEWNGSRHCTAEDLTSDAILSSAPTSASSTSRSRKSSGSSFT